MNLSAQTELSSPQSPKQNRRMAFLDVIRGIAALAVVIEHASERFFPGYLKAANEHFTFGVFGVATFFIVSGFIIPVSLERHNSLPEFWRARFFRLYPMYWFSLLLCVAVPVLSARSLSVLATLPWRVVVANTTMLQEFLGFPNLTGLYWTLTMELIFYFLCSVLFLFGSLSRSLRFLWFAIALNVIVTFTLGFVFHRSFPAGRSALILSALFGTVLYRHYHGSISFSSILKVAPFLALSLAFGFWFRFHLYPSSADPRAFRFLGVSMSYFGAYSVFLVLFHLRDRAMPAPLVWLGQISYSLYLIHWVGLLIVPRGESPVLRFFAAILIAMTLSAGTFFLIEWPGMALYRRLFPIPDSRKNHRTVVPNRHCEPLSVHLAAAQNAESINSN